MILNHSKRYIIFLDLPRVVERKIDAVRKNLGSKSIKKWPAHITLKYDEEFFLTKKEFSALVRKFYKNVPEIFLTLGSPEIVFIKKKNGWNINLPVLNKSRIVGFVTKFSKKIEPFIRKDVKGSMKSTHWEQGKSFIPHVSLKGGTGKTLAKKMYEKAKKENFTLNFPVKLRCKSVTLAAWENNKWCKVLRFKLKESNSNG
jgi:2'-5' RNA ligase